MAVRSLSQISSLQEARTAVESLRKYNPTFLNLENVREDIEMWDSDKNEVEEFLLGLQKAGLKYGSDSASTQIEPKLKSNPTVAQG